MPIDSTVPPSVGALAADLFDGRTSRPQPVQLTVVAGRLHVMPAAADGPAPFTVPLREVKWPERTRHGTRTARLPGGASLQSADSAAWDDWVATAVKRDSAVVRAQQSWRGVLVASALLLAVAGSLYLWGLPALARGIVAAMPQQVDTLVGEQAMQSLEGRLVFPSRLPEADRARLRSAFGQAVRQAWGPQAAAWQLEFRAGRSAGGQRGGLGPNAFALPGGVIVLTDELVELVKDDDAVIGVLGHEFGHVRRRHGMRQVVQVSALGAAGALVFGDYGSFVGSVPLVLASMGYSRNAEREADEDAIRLLQATGRSPLAMVRFFDAVQKAYGEPAAGLGIALSSHPADAERIARFRAAAGQP